MKHDPTTIEEARKKTYGFSFQNFPYVEGKCAFSVMEGGRGGGIHQCAKKNGHGPGDLYCKQHARKVDPDSVEKFPVWEVNHWLSSSVTIKERQAMDETAQQFVMADGSRTAKRPPHGRIFRDHREALIYAHEYATSLYNQHKRQTGTWCSRVGELAEEIRKLP